MRVIAQLIIKALTNLGDQQTYREVRQVVEEISSRFPVPALG
jgi:glycine/serine hydroxymethyltransferase